MILRKKRSRGVVARKKRKEEKETKKQSAKVWSFWRQDVPSVRIPGVSCLASGRSRQDVAEHYYFANLG